MNDVIELTIISGWRNCFQNFSTGFEHSRKKVASKLKNEDLSQTLLISNQNRDKLLKYLNFLENKANVVNEKISVIVKELDLNKQKVNIMNSCLSDVEFTESGVTAEDHYEVQAKENYFKVALNTAKLEKEYLERDFMNYQFLKNETEHDIKLQQVTMTIMANRIPDVIKNDQHE
ncbi:hypothetical protein HELRODRAFT_165514 [Helobdella robusta]|uniref:Uncharacterized protein n=1 Tax=Helobdella robusta TaxID=6412 RepID=T1EWY4_HELRO|nr:hypothetical protein HELRODRAFT_165514 [Helobdella robusta]ESN91475.1 hypothetical protein HELRODRAFT_165514 [Helobdella robusta]